MLTLYLHIYLIIIIIITTVFKLVGIYLSQANIH